MDRLRHRLHFEQRIGGNQFLGFGKRPVGYGDLPAGEPDARALRARLAAVGCQQHASVGHLCNEFPTPLLELWARRNARLGILVSLEQPHDPHGGVSLSLRNVTIFWLLFEGESFILSVARAPRGSPTTRRSDPRSRQSGARRPSWSPAAAPGPGGPARRTAARHGPRLAH